MGRAYDDLGVTWFEEPVSSDDLAGLRTVRTAVDADVAAGEYAWSLVEAQRLCASRRGRLPAGGRDPLRRLHRVAADRRRRRGAQPRGVRALRARAARAVAAAVTNLRHVEWFHDHVRIEQMLFSGRPPPPAEPCARPDRPRPRHDPRPRTPTSSAWPDPSASGGRPYRRTPALPRTRPSLCPRTPALPPEPAAAHPRRPAMPPEARAPGLPEHGVSGASRFQGHRPRLRLAASAIACGQWFSASRRSRES